MPIEQDAFFSMLGLAMRAGQLTFGEDSVRKAITSGTAGLVLLDDGASENTKKRMRDSCSYYAVQLLETEKTRLGAAVGRGGRMSVAVKKGPLCDRLIELARQNDAATLEG